VPCLSGRLGLSVPCACDLTVQRRLLARTRTHPFRLIARFFVEFCFDVCSAVLDPAWLMVPSIDHAA